MSDYIDKIAEKFYSHGDGVLVRILLRTVHLIPKNPLSNPHCNIHSTISTEIKSYKRSANTTFKKKISIYDLNLKINLFLFEINLKLFDKNRSYKYKNKSDNSNFLILSYAYYSSILFHFLVAMFFYPPRTPTYPQESPQVQHCDHCRVARKALPISLLTPITKSPYQGAHAKSKKNFFNNFFSQ